MQYFIWLASFCAPLTKRNFCRFEGLVSWFMAMTENRVGFFFRGGGEPWRSWRVALFTHQLAAYPIWNWQPSFEISFLRDFSCFLLLKSISLGWKFVLHFTTLVYLRGVDSHLVVPNTPNWWLVFYDVRSNITWLANVSCRRPNGWLHSILIWLVWSGAPLTWCQRLPYGLMSQWHAKLEWKITKILSNSSSSSFLSPLWISSSLFFNRIFALRRLHVVMYSLWPISDMCVNRISGTLRKRDEPKKKGWK